MPLGYQLSTGTAEVTTSDTDETVLATPGAGKVLRIMRGTVMVTLAATGGTGEVALEDGVGGTRIFEADADAVGVFSFDFGDDGYPLTANTVLNLTVDGAGTNQATARATVIAKIAG